MINSFYHELCMTDPFHTHLDSQAYETNTKVTLYSSFFILTSFLTILKTPSFFQWLKSGGPTYAAQFEKSSEATRIPL